MAVKNPNIGITFNTKNANAEIKSLRDELSKTRKEFQLQDETLKSNGRSLDTVKSKIRDLKAQEETQTQISNKYRDAIEKINTAQSNAIKRQKEASDAYEKAKSATNKNTDELQKLKNELDKANSAVSKNTKDLKAYEGKLLDSELATKKLGNASRDLQISSVSDKLEKIGSTTTKIGAGLTAGVTFPLVMVGKQALETASNLTEVQNVVDVAFKDSAGTINTWSQSLLDTYGISELTAKKTAGMYKAMANGAKVSDEQGTEMAKNLTQLTADFASFYNVSLDESNTAIAAVFTGETETLKRYGIVMTDVNLQNYALSQGIKKSTLEMTANEKTVLRYNFMMDQLKDVTGDFARTSGSTANQTRLLQERYKALSADLARELLPMATDLLKYGNDLLKNFNQMDDATKKRVVSVIALAAALGPVVTVTGSIITVGSKVVPLIAKLSTGLFSVGAAGTAAAGGTAAMGGAMSLLTGPVGWVIGALALVGVGTFAVVKANKEAEKSYYDWGNSIEDAGNKYEEAKEKSKLSSENTEEWKRLNTVISNSKTPSDELTAAQAKRKEIEQWFIDNYGDYLTAEEKKNGITQASINKINEKNDALTESKRLELENELKSQQSSIPDKVNSVNNLKAQNEDLQNQADQAEIAKGKLLDLKNEWEDFSKGDHSDTEIQKKLEDITKRANEASGQDFSGSGILGIENAISDLGKETDDCSEKINNNSKNIKSATDSLDSYKQQASSLIELKLGDTYDGFTHSMRLLSEAQDEYNQKGTVSKSTLDELIKKFPELADAGKNPELLSQKFDELKQKLAGAKEESNKLNTYLDGTPRDINVNVHVNTKFTMDENGLHINGVPAGQVLVGSLPKQWDANGTDNAYEGSAVVNEKGRELIQGKDGSIRYIDSDGPALTYLHSGDKVYTAEESKKMVNAKSVHLLGFAEGKTPFEQAKEDFDYKKDTSEVSLGEELAWWQDVLNRYADDADAVKEANKEIYSLNKSLQEKAKEDLKNEYDDRLDESNKWLDKKKEEGDYTAVIDGLNRVKEYTTDYYNQGVMSVKEYQNAIDKLNDSISETDVAILNAKKDAADKQNQISEQWIEDEKFYGRMDEQQEYQAWLRVRERAVADENYDYIREIDKKLYTIKSDYIKKLSGEQLDAAQKEYDAQRQAINDKYDLIDQEEQDSEQSQNRREILSQMDLYKNAVTVEGKNRYSELQDQLNQLDKEKDKQLRELQKADELKKVDDEWTKYQENQEESLKQMTSSFSIAGQSMIQISSTISSVLSTIANSIQSLPLTGTFSASPNISNTYNQYNNQTIGSPASATAYSRANYNWFRLGVGGFKNV